MADASTDDASQDDLAAVLAGLQAQIADLTATVEAHQRLFERLRSTGMLPADHDGERP